MQWDNVTPGDMEEGIVNAIEVSPHSPAAAYVAFTRYKFNDFTPHIYKTDDYGQSWRRVVTGIAPEAHLRVVREDPLRRGPLYAGTEAGLYVSWDDGNEWQPLQPSMPVTPITDLKVQARDDDLVAATGGRGFWILDDLSPLQRVTDQVVTSELYLFKPRDAYRIVGGGGSGDPLPGVGKNPPVGAVVDFYLSAVSDSSPITLEFLDEAGNVVRSFSSARTDDQEADSTALLKVREGHNRFAWNLRHQAVKNVPGLYVFGTLQGRRAVPGSYAVRITSGQERRTQLLNVLKDPRVDVTDQGFREQDQLVAEISGALLKIHESVIQLRCVKEQVKGLMERFNQIDGAETVYETATGLVDRLDALEDSLVQNRTVDGQTVINFPSRLNFHFTYLMGAVEGAEGIVTAGARQTFQDLKAQWSVLRAELENLLGEELGRLNSLVADGGIPAVVVPRE